MHQKFELHTFKRGLVLMGLNTLKGVLLIFFSKGELISECLKFSKKTNEEIGKIDGIDVVYGRPFNKRWHHMKAHVQLRGIHGWI